MQFIDAIHHFTRELQSYSETPRLDAELLILHSAKKTREYIFTYPEKTLTETEIIDLKKWIQRRKSGEPISYITGRKEFWSLSFAVTPDVLIPRPETEHLIEWTLAHLPSKQSLLLADLGTGSGAIGIAIAHERPHWTIHATDNDPNTLAIASQNADNYQLKNINFYLSDWCSQLPQKNYHAILCNPPYLDSRDSHFDQLRFEPKNALDGGHQGLSAIEIVIAQAKNYLSQGGLLIIEHGYDQQEKVIQLMQSHDYQHIKNEVDLANQPRFVIGEKS